MSWRPPGGAIFAVYFGFFVALGGASVIPANAFRNVKVGEEVPSFTLKTGSGPALESASLKGRAVILVFLRPEDRHSSKLLEDVTEVLKQLEQTSLVTLAVISGGGGVPPGFEGSRDDAILLLPDPDRTLSGAFGLVVYPSVAVVSKELKLTCYLPGRGTTFIPQLRECALAALGKGKLGGAERVAQGGKALLRSALQLLKEGKGAEAERALRDAIAAEPGLADAHLNLGHILLSRGDVKGARSAFESALATGSQRPLSLLGLGMALRVEGRLEESVRALREAAALSPAPGRAFYELGRVYELQGDWQKAREYYQKAVHDLTEKVGAIGI